MQISSVSGNTSKRTITDIDLDDYLYDLRKNKSDAIIATKTTTSNIKTISVESSRYTRLDSSMPAVSFVNFNTKKGGLFLTNITPPKYIKSFECERVSNSVGKFTLTLQAPIDTFSTGSDDLNIRLINLFGHIDSGTMDDANGFQCELSYGWRGSSSNSVIKYTNALITGMTVNYTGNYYTYTIVGLVNQISDKSFETGVKILPLDALYSIDTSKLSSSSLETYKTYTSHTVTNLLDTSGASVTSYKLVIPAGSKIYEFENGTVTATSKTTETDIPLLYSNRQNNTAYWTPDYMYCHGTVRGTGKVECYIVSDIQFYEFKGGSITDDTSTGDEIEQPSLGMDLTLVKEGERISDKVEILAQYLYGDLYDVTVAHTDKVYDKTENISTILSSLKNPEASNADVSSDTTNETTTSLQTWLRQMIKACQDNTESETYKKYALYDTNGDNVLSEADLADISNINQTAIADKWKKHGIDTYTYETKNSRGNINTRETTAFSRKMTEAEFNAKYKDYEYLNAPYSTEYLQPQNFIGPTQDFIGPIQSPYSTMSRTYADYEADYNAYQASKNYAKDSAELNELLDSFDGVISGGASAVQYQLYYVDAAAGKKGQIYIGPAKDEQDKYQYVVGNNAKHSNVIDFNISEDLVYLISAVKSYVSASNSGLYQIDVTTGGIVKGVVDTSSDRIDTKEEYATRVANEILKTATGQCKASLTLLSDANSRKIQTTDNISILCQLNGGKSLFSGSYYVASVKDTISESGTLTTSLELQFTQSTAFKTVRDIILTHLNKALANSAATKS